MPTATRQGELIPYGLHLLQSFDGASFEELPVKRVETTLHDQDGSFLFDEQFEAAPSTDCRYLKVQLKQFSRLPYLYADGVEGFVDVNMPHLSMIRQVRCSGPVQPLNPGEGADLPLGEEETDEEETREEDEKKTVSSTKKSSDSSKSSSGGDSRVETTTSTSTSTSSSSSTTDSNNSTTTYTTNYIFVGSSPESAAALCDILGIEPDALENLQTILGSTDGPTAIQEEKHLLPRCCIRARSSGCRSSRRTILPFLLAARRTTNSFFICASPLLQWLPSVNDCTFHQKIVGSKERKNRHRFAGG